jgi:multisubunit Na+/H+ antiporter MnhB subunit
VSAYYHSPMQDFFVSGLCIVAFLLLTYMSGQPRTLDFRLSAIAGVALFFVVFFPTKRSDLQPEALLCGPHADPQPAGCSVTEAWWGEDPVAAVHAVAAAVFIGSLLVICLAFAYRDARKHRGSARTATHLFSAVAIAVAVLWVIFGPSRTFGLQPLWLGEFVSTVAFGVSWFVAGHGVQLARRRPYPVP